MTDTPDTPEAVERLATRLNDAGNREYVDVWALADEAAAMLRVLAAKLAEAEERLQSATMDGYDMAKEDYRDKLQAAEAALATAREDALREAVTVVYAAAGQSIIPEIGKAAAGILALIERKP